MRKATSNDEIVRRRELIWEHSRIAAEQIARLLGTKKRPATEEIATLIAEEFQASKI